MALSFIPDPHMTLKDLKHTEVHTSRLLQEVGKPWKTLGTFENLNFCIGNSGDTGNGWSPESFGVQGSDGAVSSEVEISGSKADLHRYLVGEKKIVRSPKHSSHGFETIEDDSIIDDSKNSFSLLF